MKVYSGKDFNRACYAAKQHRMLMKKTKDFFIPAIIRTFIILCYINILLMPTFVVLGKLTHKGLDQIKDVAQRDTKAEEIIKKAGGKTIALYYTFGHYDFVAIVETPSEEAMVKILLEIGRFGNVSTQTLLAFTSEQLYKVTSTLK